MKWAWICLLGSFFFSVLFVAPYHEFSEKKKEVEELHNPTNESRIKLDVSDVDGRKKLAATEIELTKAKDTIETLSVFVDALKYSDMATLNLIGKPQMDSTITFTTPVSKAMEGSYTIADNSRVTLNKDAIAERKFRDTIALEPRFPFSYLGLAVILMNRGDSEGTLLMQKAELILKKTTAVPSHHGDHDHALSFVSQILAAKDTTPPH